MQKGENEKANKTIIITSIVLFLVLFIPGILGLLLWKNFSQPQEQSTGQTKKITRPKEQWQPTNIHPWQMFHGNYNHIGFTNVKGPKTATLKWKFYAGKIEGESPNSVAIATDGTIYLTGARKLFSITPEGKEKWSKPYNHAQGPAISMDGKTVYFVGENSIIAVDTTGKELWRFQTNGNTIFGPTIGPDGTVYQGSWDGYFYAVTKEGKLKWKYKTQGAVSYPSSIGRDGKIYLGGGDAHAGGDGNFYAFNPDGSLAWKYNTNQIRVGSPAIGLDGFIYVPASPMLFVFDSKGNLQWSTQQGRMPRDDVSGILTPAIDSEGIIHLGNSQGVIAAVDPDTGQVKWRYAIGSEGLPSFPVVDANGTSYFGSFDYHMYAIDKNGQLLWKYKTEGKLTEAAPALGSDGTLYFTSDDGYLYALKD